MVDSEEYQKAKRSLLYRLSRQALHSETAKKWLQIKGFSPEVAKAVTTSLQEKGLIQDEEWLQAYVGSKKQKYGPRRLQQNLRVKGIDLDLSTLSVFREDEASSLQHLLETRYRHKDLRNPKERASVFAALARRGFNGSTIQQAISLFVATNHSA